MNEPSNDSAVEDAAQERAARTSSSTRALLEEALAEAKSLARIEIALAKEEAVEELRGLHRSYVFFLFCAGSGLVAISALVASLVLVTNAVIGFVAGGSLAVLAAGAGYLGYKRIPLHPMEKTRHRLLHETHDIKERLA